MNSSNQLIRNVFLLILLLIIQVLSISKVHAQTTTHEFESGIMIAGHKLLIFEVTTEYADPTFDGLTYYALPGQSLVVVSIEGNIPIESIILTDESEKSLMAEKVGMRATGIAKEMGLADRQDSPLGFQLSKLIDGKATSEPQTLYIASITRHRGQILLRFKGNDDSVYVVPEQ